ncbi:hypothetical protein C8Q80DRAFT_1305729 [Daedaleopsis nitida]|nr:hypothetical protein C8Q80DRAFT_1305729 [Daedaleopsis nitida]
MSALTYLPHVLYSCALTSITIHHLYQRKTAEEDRTHVAAQLSILEGLHARLAAREPVPAHELDRLWRLARSHDVWRAAALEDGGEGAGAGGGAGAGAGGAAGTGTDARVKSVHLPPRETVGWKEVLLGRRFDTARTEELDRKDLERVGTRS